MQSADSAWATDSPVLKPGLRGGGRGGPGPEPGASILSYNPRCRHPWGQGRGGGPGPLASCPPEGSGSPRSHPPEAHFL